MGTPWSPPDRSNPLASAQIGEQETFISELLNELTLTIQDLETHQIHMFYEAVGLMIGADTSRDKQEQYLVGILMAALSAHTVAGTASNRLCVSSAITCAHEGLQAWTKHS